MPRLLILVLIILATSLIPHSTLGQSQPTPTQVSAGYIDKGANIEFVFGPQATIRVQGIAVSLNKRRKELKSVTLAGDFTDWDPKSSRYQMKKVGEKLYQITVPKSEIGKPGETHQFKFVLNHEYWVEPPKEATNRLIDKEGNVNYTVKL